MDREPELERRAPSRVAPDRDFPAVPFHDPAGDGEAEPASALVGASTPVELIEHVRKILGRNAPAAIGHLEMNETIVGSPAYP